MRNTGSAPAAIDTILLSGYDFAIQSEPSLPYTLAPYVGLASEAEIDVDFTPTIAASYSATLVVNTISIVLVSAPTAAVTLADGNTALNTGATVDFGSVAVGSTKTLGFLLSNLSPGNIDVGTLAVSGAYFAGPIGLSAPVSLTPGQTASFKVSFAPQSGTLAQGVLTVGTSTFKLTGQGLSPPLPSASIVFASDVGASAQQNSVTIPLASASQVTGNGTLTHGVPIQRHRRRAMTRQSNFCRARCGRPPSASPWETPRPRSAAKPSMAFQTGATAGTITFTLTLGDNAPQLSTLVIPPSTIVLDGFTAVRRYGALDVALSGFDNTYSASQLVFTFYDLKGLPLPQGVDQCRRRHHLSAILRHHASRGNVRAARDVSRHRGRHADWIRQRPDHQFHRRTTAQQIPFGTSQYAASMLLASVVETSRRVADTSKRLEKIAFSPPTSPAQARRNRDRGPIPGWTDPSRPHRHRLRRVARRPPIHRP